MSHSLLPPWTTARQALLSSVISQRLIKFMCIESVMLSNHLILCYPLLLLPSIFPSIRVFSNELALCIRQLKYWSSSYSFLRNTQGQFPLRLSDLISWQFKGLLRVFSTTIWKHQPFGAQPFYDPTHIYTWLQEKHNIDYTNLCHQSDVSFFIPCLGLP